FVRLARIEEIAVVEGVPKGAIQSVIEGVTLVLPLGGVVDLAREQARLQKEIARLDGEIGKLAAKLANPGFLAKADPDIVEEQRARASDATGERNRLKAAYERIAAA
ncbi:MAG: valine--tRNA ligase, partial [Stellaceae bacterium]